MNHLKCTVSYSGIKVSNINCTLFKTVYSIFKNEQYFSNQIIKRCFAISDFSNKSNLTGLQDSENSKSSFVVEKKAIQENYNNSCQKEQKIDDEFFASILYKVTSKKSNNKIADAWENKLRTGPGLRSFVNSNLKPDKNIHRNPNIPYVPQVNGNKQKVFLDIYGCQMNVNDSEVIASILEKSNYHMTSELKNADIVLLVTCSIRDNAEQKIWHRLKFLRHLKRKNDGKTQISKIGVLGCMAERLKEKLIEQEKVVDIVAGPDSYKDLPRLLALSDNQEAAINVQLSFDETYADITPVRLNKESKTAYVTIMRGCDNMCTYCIVPFTRGRERSRPISSILQEVQQLSNEGVKEVTLLGQNVNSYRDTSEMKVFMNSKTNLVKGFKTVYKMKEGGLRFSDLLCKVSDINPEMRIRFTSPHPKDFPDEVLHLISEKPNICKQLHIPAQSGNSSVLSRMRRGYSREAYIDLIHHIKDMIPKIHLSSDFICGFCDETDQEFEDTLTLMELVKYNMAYIFAYSMREKTTAHRRYVDNVSQSIKLERLKKLNAIFREQVEKLNKAQIGQQQLVLVEGLSKRSNKDLQGRNDGNTKVIIQNQLIPESNSSGNYRPIKNGDYIVVQICNANSQVLTGIPLYHSSIIEYHSSEDKN